MLYALRISYPVILLYFLFAASIYVDFQSNYKGLAFMIFAVGCIGTLYQKTWHKYLTICTMPVYDKKLHSAHDH